MFGVIAHTFLINIIIYILGWAVLNFLYHVMSYDLLSSLVLF